MHLSFNPGPYYPASHTIGLREECLKRLYVSLLFLTLTEYFTSDTLLTKCVCLGFPHTKQFSDSLGTSWLSYSSTCLILSTGRSCQISQVKGSVPPVCPHSTLDAIHKFRMSPVLWTLPPPLPRIQLSCYIGSQNLGKHFTGL